MVKGICEVRKHRDKAKARPIEFMANTTLSLKGEEAGRWLESWWKMVAGVPQMGCLARDISRSRPSLSGCKWANRRQSRSCIHKQIQAHLDRTQVQMTSWIAKSIHSLFGLAPVKTVHL